MEDNLDMLGTFGRVPDLVNTSTQFGNFDYFHVVNSLQRHILDRITIQPGLMGGRPTIRGLRFTVGDLLELLANGLSEKDILEQHPILEKEDIAAALHYASLKMKNTVVIHAA